MPEKPTTEPKVFVWETEDGETVTLPLRVPMGMYIEFMSVLMTEDNMLAALTKLAPAEVERFGQMDRNDFVGMFHAWQKRYAGGASLGESEGSPT